MIVCYLSEQCYQLQRLLSFMLCQIVHQGMWRGKGEEVVANLNGLSQYLLAHAHTYTHTHIQPEPEYVMAR
jgi:hypothetical protein